MQPAPTLPGVVERLGGFLRHIGLTLAGRVSWTTLSPLLVARVCKRFRLIKWRFERIEALVSKGEYKPRRRSIHSSGGARKPPPPPPDPRMRKFGWLEQVLPDVAMLRGGFLSQLRDPRMVALIEAAPVALIPPLRSICWMLKLKPPPLLALPKRPAPSAEPPSPPAAPCRPTPARDERFNPGKRRRSIQIPRLARRPKPA